MLARCPYRTGSHALRGLNGAAIPPPPPPHVPAPLVQACLRARRAALPPGQAVNRPCGGGDVKLGPVTGQLQHAPLR